MADEAPTEIVAHDPAPMSAAERLRAFEDETFSKDGVLPVRINDRIERGSGSPYQMAAPEVREQYAALEKLVEAEQKLADAKAALAVAEEAHGQALAAVEGFHAPAE